MIHIKGAAVATRKALTKEQRAAVPEIVRRYLSLESVQEIAKDYDVDRRVLYDWMFTEHGEAGYEELVTKVLVARVADADAALEKARTSKDPVQVSACREACRFFRMDLERRRPGLYGQKQEVRHTQAPSFTVVLLDKASDGGRVVEGKVEKLALEASATTTGENG